MVLLELQKFYGADEKSAPDFAKFQSWIFSLENHFAALNVCESHKLDIGERCMAGKAEEWFNKKTHRSWEELKNGLKHDFFPSEDLVRQSPMFKIKALQQEGDIYAYVKEFLKLAGNLNLPEEFLADLFKTGLLEWLRCEIESMKEPKLEHMIGRCIVLQSNRGINGDAVRGRGGGTKRDRTPKRDAAAGAYTREYNKSNRKNKAPHKCYLCGQEKHNRLFYVAGLINGERVRLLLSSGSAHNILAERIATKANLNLIKQELPSFEGQSRKFGKKALNVVVQIEDFIFKDDFWSKPVPEDAGFDGILGCPWHVRFKVQEYVRNFTLTLEDDLGRLHALTSIPDETDPSVVICGALVSVLS